MGRGGRYKLLDLILNSTQDAQIRAVPKGLGHAHIRVRHCGDTLLDRITQGSAGPEPQCYELGSVALRRRPQRALTRQLAIQHNIAKWSR